MNCCTSCQQIVPPCFKPDLPPSNFKAIGPCLILNGQSLLLCSGFVLRDCPDLALEMTSEVTAKALWLGPLYLLSF